MRGYLLPRFVYVCRNPKDVVVSKWISMNKLRPMQLHPSHYKKHMTCFAKGFHTMGPSGTMCWDIGKQA
ncbi:unnamed protein product [Prunus brigantina]